MCPKCYRDLPESMIQPMFVDGAYVDQCPICALELRNSIHGLPEGTPFTGEMAAAMFDAAVEHCRTTGQKIPIIL